MDGLDQAVLTPEFSCCCYEVEISRCASDLFRFTLSTSVGVVCVPPPPLCQLPSSFLNSPNAGRLAPLSLMNGGVALRAVCWLRAGQQRDPEDGGVKGSGPQR